MSKLSCKLRAMSLRHALLGMLAVAAEHGLRARAALRLLARNAWHASHSQIYPELGEAAGGGHGRGRRRGRAPQPHLRHHRRGPRGPARLAASRPSPTAPSATRPTIRWFLLALLSPEDRRAVLERELRDVTEYHAGLRPPPRRSTRSTTHPFRPMVDLAVRTSARDGRLAHRAAGGDRMTLTGGCNCGAVRFEVTEPLKLASYCHCTRLPAALGRRRLGRAASRSRARSTSPPAPDALRAWKSESGRQQVLLRRAAAPTSTPTTRAHPDSIGIRLGAFDDDPGVRPSVRQFVRVRRGLGADSGRRAAPPSGEPSRAALSVSA